MLKHRELAEKFAEQGKDILGSTFIKSILYGSCARKEQNEQSDIDIIFLTTIPEEAIRPVENKLFDLAFDYEICRK